jgi:hypothetical protein
MLGGNFFMKKAGITTFHHSTSLGANLQAYGTQTFLEKNGFEAEFINYNRNYTQKKHVSHPNLITEIKGNLINNLAKIITRMNYKDNVLKGEKLKDFRSNQLHIGSKIYNTIDELKASPPNYDVFVTGSDQVWNPYTFFQEAYFLTFAPKDSKKIAYAPSIGVNQIDNDKKSIMKKYLNHVDYLSCREEQGAKVLAEVTGRNVVHVLDPTLLLKPEDWNKIAIPPKIKRPYLLCYFLGSMKYSRKIAERVAQKNNLDVVVIPSSIADNFSFAKKQKGVGPREFLGLFKEASFICTDSFHGTAFAINYNKPFLSFRRRDYKDSLTNVSRLESLTNILGISDRLLSPESKWNDDYLTLEYKSINKNLEKQRNISMDYFVKALT